ncbi:hypothetical protein D9C73_009281 [Collichthys lucidus]|uniref:Uncharacterized protein n=1 Tax=Collichthys lucidus TaxID=240159 RepID=A0A4U5UK51_COLLU|nr:hypothetical protein D9C73_009281 [Collichthys lucidus]
MCGQRRESERGGVRREAEEDPRVSQHPSSQPPAPGPPQQTPGPGQPAQPVRSPSAGTNLLRGRLQAVSSQGAAFSVSAHGLREVAGIRQREHPPSAWQIGPETERVRASVLAEPE